MITFNLARNTSPTFIKILSLFWLLYFKDKKQISIYF